MSENDVPQANPRALSRRQFVRGAGAAGAGLAAVSVAGPRALAAGAPRPPEPATPSWIYDCGVASGDPLPRAVTIWTRTVPAPATTSTQVRWELSKSLDFATVLRSGSVRTDASRDHTVMVKVGNLDPDTWYYYRFRTRGEYSPVGRTRTAPAVGARPQRLRFAVASCQMYSEGYYNAYRAMAGEDIDFLLHLGDYIYEYGSASSEYGYHRKRPDPVDHPKTKDEFRAKYKLYRSDRDLQWFHQNFPMIAMWDDHEIFDDYDKFVDPAIRDAGYAAWFEYMPYFAPAAEPNRLYRKLTWGKLVDLLMIDLAQYRDPEIPEFSWNVWYPGRAISGTGRSILGDAQKAWLKQQLVASTATWRVWGNPQMLAPLRIIDLEHDIFRWMWPWLPPNAGLYLNGTQWDGYQVERKEILEVLADPDHLVRNNIVLTGDIHSWWVVPVKTDVDDDYAPVVAHEFVMGSVTSPSLEDKLKTTNPLWSSIVQLMADGSWTYINLFDHGYGLVEVTPTETTVEFKKVDILTPDNPATTTLAKFRVRKDGWKIETVA